MNALPRSVERLNPRPLNRGGRETASQREVEMEKLENELLSAVRQLSFGEKERARQTATSIRKNLLTRREHVPLRLLPFSSRSLHGPFSADAHHGTGYRENQIDYV